MFDSVFYLAIYISNFSFSRNIIQYSKLNMKGQNENLKRKRSNKKKPQTLKSKV